MSDTVIRVENLGKKYLIRHEQRERYTALRDVMTNNVKRFGRKLLSPFTFHHSPFTESKEEFWALKDVSFEVNHGDKLGIIGRNGAGKTTLLKLLSRITEPTTGRITIKGRVASLLEVGTGFHPELTGRENIFLNGAILGMSKAEIKRKFDEIVAFSEVERFLDTPVKRYSSGMYVRLAFAVAAHLEPEILIVDEVLAVGDAQFQKKCLGKMGDVAKEGRTVLFVSHNMAAVKQLCTKAVLLTSGILSYSDYSNETISHYMQNILKTDLTNYDSYKHINGDRRAEIVRLKVNDCLNTEAAFSIYDKVKISIEYKINSSINELEFFILIYSIDGDVQLSFLQKDSISPINPKGQEGEIDLYFTNYLAPGKYLVSAGIFDKTRVFVDWVEYVNSFVVDQTFSDGRPFDNRLGKVLFVGKWISR